MTFLFEAIDVSTGLSGLGTNMESIFCISW